ncbi:unnamed protein product [Cochlearia groenlandica]
MKVVTQKPSLYLSSPFESTQKQPTLSLLLSSPTVSLFFSHFISKSTTSFTPPPLSRTVSLSFSLYLRVYYLLHSSYVKKHKVTIKNHPYNGGDPDKGVQDGYEFFADRQPFKELAQAYEVLSDLEKSDIYDQYGEDALKEGMGGGAFCHDPLLSSFPSLVVEVETHSEVLAAGKTKSVTPDSDYAKKCFCPQCSISCKDCGQASGVAFLSTISCRKNCNLFVDGNTENYCFKRTEVCISLDLFKYLL